MDLRHKQNQNHPSGKLIIDLTTTANGIEIEINDNKIKCTVTFVRSISTNSKYASFLPAYEDGTSIVDNYGRLLDIKFSLQPLLRAVESMEKVPGVNEPSTSGAAPKIDVSMNVNE